MTRRAEVAEAQLHFTASQPIQSVRALQDDQGECIRRMLTGSETLILLFGRGVTALMLHDSVLSPAAAAAGATMQTVFTKLTGGARISIKTTIR